MGFILREYWNVLHWNYLWCFVCVVGVWQRAILTVIWNNVNCILFVMIFFIALWNNNIRLKNVNVNTTLFFNYLRSSTTRFGLHNNSEVLKTKKKHFEEFHCHCTVNNRVRRHSLRESCVFRYIHVYRYNSSPYNRYIRVYTHIYVYIHTYTY